jgi:hypothetical protein
VGPSSDPLEREADRIAEAVVASDGTETALASSAPQGLMQRKCAGCEDEEGMVRGKDAGRAGPVDAQSASAIVQSAGQGRPLSTPERAYFEPRFGHRFDRVRVHDGASSGGLASELRARAFTYGEDIFLGRGEYRPESQEGRRLLAHELAHTLQQAPSRQSRPRRS